MTLREFRSALFQGFFHSSERFDNNFDFFRYSSDGVDRSKKINLLRHARYFFFVLSNIKSLYAVSLLFLDAASRDLYIQLIRYRLFGHRNIHIKEGLTWDTISAMYQKAASYATRSSALEFNGMFGELKHHEKIPAETGTVMIDAWSSNVAYGMGSENHRQYYFDRDDVRIRPEEGDYVIDGGACFGETSIFFSSSVGSAGKVFSFDPLPAHINVVKFNIEQNSLADRITIVAAGIGEVSNNVSTIDDRFNEVASPGFSMVGMENKIPILSIDDFVKNQEIKKIDFIKMDIEGFELSALKGAANTIEKYRPKLAISLYHKKNDFIDIPVYLNTLFPFYRFYLDHYTIHQEETVLYAIA
jgi:FkbM family methyltransferase